VGATRRRPAPNLRQLSAAESKAKVLEAAKEVFASCSYEQVKVAEIAERAGVAHGLVFHHFGSKRELYLAVLAEYRDRLANLHDEDTSAATGLRVRRSLRAHVDFMAGHREVALRVILARSGPGAEEFTRSQQAGLDKTAAILGIDLDSPALRATMRAYADSVDELVRSWLTGEVATVADDLVEAIVALLQGALRAAGRIDPGYTPDATVRSLNRR
jgi:AcrR family transcriptional regulator